MRLRTNMTLVFVALVLIGCSSRPKLMPTPNIYLSEGGYPESGIPDGLRSNKVDLKFVTDRARETSDDGALVYGTGRSASLGFGSVIVHIGNVAFINVNDVKSFVGHGYYLSSPSTSSDIIRVINTGSKPGESERPLIHQKLNFWDMPAKYPGKSE